MKLAINDRAIVRKIIFHKLEKEKGSLSPTQLNSFNSILDKMQNDKFTFDKSETLCFAHLANEYIKAFYTDYRINNCLFWLDLTTDVKQRIEEKDAIIELGNQLNQKYIDSELQERLKVCSNDIHIPSTIDKMKESESILISSKTNPYKLGFIYEKDFYNSFGIKDSLNLAKMSFGSIKDWAGTEATFYDTISRQEAKDIFSKLNIDNYPKENIDFLIRVLQ